MDTKQFLEAILPDEGYIVLAEFRRGSKAPLHHFFESVEDAAEAVQRLDAKGSDVFHACASYTTNENRKQANVKLVKSFWLDIDVGKADSYQTKQEALQALGEVCTALGWQVPMIVSSGRGLHCYWPLTEAVTATVWKAGVTRLRSALDAMGFKHDPARTTDQASVLRPVGAHWRKDGEREVKLVRSVAPADFQTLMAGVDKYLGENSVELPKQPAYAGLFEVERLTEKPEYPPSSAISVASMCQQLARMRDMRGAIAEPEWRNAIGVIKNCVEGEALCHEWSQGDPRYDRDETQTKIDNWTTGPTTCQQFAATNPHGCNGCKYKDKVKSPIQLGYTAEIEEKIEIPVTPSLRGAGFDPMELKPKGYRWNEESGRIERLVQDDDGVPSWIEICDSIFYPTTRVQMEDGTWAQRCTMQVTKGRWREFEIPTKTLVSRDGLPAALAAYEVITMPGKGSHVATYLMDWLASYKRHNIEINTYKHYGWHKDFTGFLFGDRMLNSDGTEVSVIRASNMSGGNKLDEPFANAVETGSVAEWSRLFNLIYNRKGAEHYQFTALALLSSPIVGLVNLDQFKGIPIAMTGDGGSGKTSLAMAACAAYGKPSAFLFEATSATINSFDPFIAGLKHLPCVLDELTGRDPKQVSDKLYALCNGGSRPRADQKGNLSNVNHSWNLISFITGNTNITESMRQLEKTRADASMVRIFEIFIDKNANAKLFKDLDVAATLKQLFEHTGGAGRMFVKALMEDPEKVRAAFMNTRERLMRDVPNYDTRERFYIDLITTAIVGGRIWKALGLIEFDLKAVEVWAVKHIMDLRAIRAEHLSSTDEQVGSLLGWLAGSILVTKGMTRGAVEPAIETVRFNGVAKARMVIGAGQERFIVAARALKEWCGENGVSYRVFINTLTDAGYIKVGSPDKATITMGTNVAGTQERVVEFVYEKVSGAAPAVPQEGKVVNLR